jgi:hypothetical protein
MKYVIVNAAGQPVSIVENPLLQMIQLEQGDRIYQLGQELRIETKLVPVKTSTRTADDEYWGAR